jgi:3-oxoadipate enol-lactonase
VRLIYDEAGSGDCVVLIHGHLFNRTLWEPQVAALRDGFRVLAPDLRGFGESPVTPGSVTMREYAADIEGLLDDLGIMRAAVVGLSMGGLVTMELAVSQPERYWAIGLVATTVEPVTSQEQVTRRQRADAVERDGMPVLALDRTTPEPPRPHRRYGGALRPGQGPREQDGIGNLAVRPGRDR